MVRIDLKPGGYPVAIDDLLALQNLTDLWGELLANDDPDDEPRVITGAWYTEAGGNTTLSKGLIAYKDGSTKKIYELHETTVAGVVGADNFSCKLVTSSSVPVTYEDAIPGTIESQIEEHFVLVAGTLAPGEKGFAYTDLKYSRAAEIGEVRTFNIAPSAISAQFNVDGTGKGFRTGWRICGDLAGRVVIGHGGSYTAGQTGGSETHQLTLPEIPTILDNAGNGFNKVLRVSPSGYSGDPITPADFDNDGLGSELDVRNYSSVMATGTGIPGISVPHPIMPPYKVMLQIERYK